MSYHPRSNLAVTLRPRIDTPVSRRTACSAACGTTSTSENVSFHIDLPRTVAEALSLVRAHAPEVGRYKNGETKLMAFFLGQVMRASKGKADPKLAQRVLEEKLAS